MPAIRTRRREAGASAPVASTSRPVRVASVVKRKTNLPGGSIRVDLVDSATAQPLLDAAAARRVKAKRRDKPSAGDKAPPYIPFTDALVQKLAALEPPSTWVFPLNKEGNPVRWPNPWILFRKVALLFCGCARAQHDISSVLAAIWNKCVEENDPVAKRFVDGAELLKYAHGEVFPNYKFKPEKRDSKPPRRARDDEEVRAGLQSVIAAVAGVRDIPMEVTLPAASTPEPTATPAPPIAGPVGGFQATPLAPLAGGRTVLGNMNTSAPPADSERQVESDECLNPMLPIFGAVTHNSGESTSPFHDTDVAEGPSYDAVHGTEAALLAYLAAMQHMEPALYDTYDVTHSRLSATDSLFPPSHDWDTLPLPESSAPLPTYYLGSQEDLDMLFREYTNLHDAPLA